MSVRGGSKFNSNDSIKSLDFIVYFVLNCLRVGRLHYLAYLFVQGEVDVEVVGFIQLAFVKRDLSTLGTHIL